VFEIATLKMEFVGEMDAVRQRRKDNMANWMTRAGRRIRLAVDKGAIGAHVDPDRVALALWIIIDGLIHSWMFDPQDFDLIALGKCVIDPYLDGLRTGRA
jgi:TetR/AcrR family acrAB operon transcriptional repressor